MAKTASASKLSRESLANLEMLVGIRYLGTQLRTSDWLKDDPESGLTGLIVCATFDALVARRRCTWPAPITAQVCAI
jgi:hypothetical protein